MRNCAAPHAIHEGYRTMRDVGVKNEVTEKNANHHTSEPPSRIASVFDTSPSLTNGSPLMRKYSRKMMQTASSSST